MPSDNFEQSLRKRLQGVEVPPKPEVWEGIKTRMHSPKWYQKKGWIGGLAASVVFLLILAGYFGLSPTSSPSEKLAQSESLQESSAQQSIPTPANPLDKDSSSHSSDRPKGNKNITLRLEKEKNPFLPYNLLPKYLPSEKALPTHKKTLLPTLLPNPKRNCRQSIDSIQPTSLISMRKVP